MLMSRDGLIGRHSDIVSLCNLPKPALIEIGLKSDLLDRWPGAIEIA